MRGRSWSEATIVERRGKNVWFPSTRGVFKRLARKGGRKGFLRDWRRLQEEGRSKTAKPEGSSSFLKATRGDNHEQTGWERLSYLRRRKSARERRPAEKRSTSRWT